MGDTTWHYGENQFDNCTKESKKRMNKISSDHVSKLTAESSDADILLLLNRTKPLRIDFSIKYGAKISANAIYKGKTSAFDLLKNDF